MNPDTFNQAVTILKTAAGKDKLDHKEEAYKLYLDGADLLLHALKTETDLPTRESIKKKLAEVINRCETLRPGLPEKIIPKVVDLTVSYKDIIGLEDVKQILRECTSLIDLHPDLFKDAQPAKRILLYGPPGTGKTMLARAMACECKRQFFAISSSDVMSKWQGESEQNVKRIFDAASKVPSILFIDEVDALFSVRSDFETDSGRRIKNEFLTRIQGFDTDAKNSPIILAATNIPWNIDPAFRRRFEKRIYIPLPSYNDRIEMFRKNLHTVDSYTLDFGFMADSTTGYSASDILNICRDMILCPIIEIQKASSFSLENSLYSPCPEDTDDAVKITVMEIPPGCVFVRPINMQDFQRVIEDTTASVTLGDLKRYSEWEDSN